MLCTVVGVPDIAQLLAFIERPPGSAGLVTQLVRGSAVIVGVMVAMAVSFTKEKEGLE
jgi:hypothetical protein